MTRRIKYEVFKIAYCQLHQCDILRSMMKARKCVSLDKHGPRGVCRHFRKNRDHPYWYKGGYD